MKIAKIFCHISTKQQISRFIEVFTEPTIKLQKVSMFLGFEGLDDSFDGAAADRALV